MKTRLVLVSGLISLLIASAATAAVTVTAEDGAALRVDAAKFSGITENAIRHAAPNAAVSVSIVIGPPEVWMSSHPLIAGRPLPADVVPPRPGSTLAGWRGAKNVFETVRARYTITDAKGAMIETLPLVLEVGHGSTLEAQLQAMRATADYIAARVAVLTH